MWNTRLFLTACLAIIGLSAWAQSDSSQVSNPKITGFLSVGISGASGNVDRYGSNYLLELRHKASKSQWVFDGHFQNFINRGRKLDETVEASLIRIGTISDKSQYYVKISGYKNTFRGLKQQWKQGIGYLHAFVDTKKTGIATRLGYQYRQNVLTGNLIDDYNDGDNHYLFFGQRSHFTLMENVTLKTQVDYDQDVNRWDNYYIEVTTRLEMEVNETLTMDLRYEYEYAGLPVTGRKKEDMTYRTSLMIRF